MNRIDDGRTCTCDLRGLSFCRATWSFGNVSATDGCFYQATAVQRCQINMLTSRSSPLMCRPRAYGHVLACWRVPVTTKESIRLLYSIDNRVHRAVLLERSWLAWFNRQTDTALITATTTNPEDQIWRTSKASGWIYGWAVECRWGNHEKIHRRFWFWWWGLYRLAISILIHMSV